MKRLGLGIVITVLCATVAGAQVVGQAGKVAASGAAGPAEEPVVAHACTSMGSPVSPQTIVGTTAVLLGHTMTKPAPTSCNTPPSVYQFSTSDVGAWTWSYYSNVFLGDLIQWYWYRPNGSLYSQTQLNFNLTGNVCAWTELQIAGHEPSTEPGMWELDIYYNGALAVVEDFTIGSVGCQPSSTTMCIDDSPGDKRFEIDVSYHTSQSGGLSGDGQAIPLASLGVTRGGLFWFFSSDNPELLVKVLNGCSNNNYHWFFASAGTNVGVTITLKDWQTGSTRTYTNPDIHPMTPIQDTAALQCP